MKLVLSGLVAVLIAAAPGQTRDAFDYRVADVGILQSRGVQNDLSVTEAQRAKMNVAAEAYSKKLAAYQKELAAQNKTQPDQQRMLSYVSELKANVLVVLKPGQLRRLREITLQRLGTAALIDQQVALRLGMSTKQVDDEKAVFAAGRKKFLGVRDSATNKVIAPYRGLKPKDKAEAEKIQKELAEKLQTAGRSAAPSLAEISKETDAKMRAILTPKQRVAWDALKGRKFDFSKA